MRILVVEDNSITAAALTELLRLDGHQADYVGDALSALTRLAAPGEPLPDVIILDLCLPGMDGEQFLVRLDKDTRWQSIPVFVTSAASLDEQGHFRQRWPKVKLLPKPYTTEQLRGLLQELNKNDSSAKSS